MMRLIDRNAAVSWHDHTRSSTRRSRAMRRRIRGPWPLLLIVTFLAVATLSVTASIAPPSGQLEDFPSGP
jgi:hypothetical protein